METNKQATVKLARKDFSLLDSAQSMFFSRELELIEKNMYETKYPALEAESLLPNRIPVPDGITKYTWRLSDERSLAVPMAGHEEGAPLSDVDAGEQSANLMSWVAAYGYNVEEIAASARLGMGLDQMRARAVRRRLAITLNYMALLGYTARSIYGLFNQQNTLTVTVAADGTGSSKLWTTKTADQVLRDMFAMVDAMPSGTVDIEGGDGVPLIYAMTKDQLRLAGILRLGTSAQDTTVLEFFRRQRPNVRVVGANYLPTAGSGGVSRQVVYDPAQVSWLVSVPFEQLPVEQKGFRYVVNCRSRGGGVITPYPKSIVYGDGS